MQHAMQKNRLWCGDVRTTSPRMAAKPGGLDIMLGGEASSSQAPADVRLEFLSHVIQKSLRLKADRWIKVLTVEEYRKIIQEFLDNAEPPLIIFTQSGPGILAVSNAPLNSPQHPAVTLTTGGGSSAARMKSLYFLKKRAEPVNREDPRSSLLFGDLAPHPLEQVLTFLDDVVAPVLDQTSKGRKENQSMQSPWPAAVSMELERQARNIRGTVNRARGLLDGKTVLYWPWTGALRTELPSRMEMESCVQQWTTQLTPLLEAEERGISERSSLSEEVLYWRNRSQDLENIFEQLKEGVVRQMAATLEEIGSAQSATFKMLLRRLIAALAEAQEISLHLKPIIKPLENLEAADVTEMAQPLRILLHTASLVWCTCAYFRQPVKLANLLRQVGNALIDRCRIFLDSRSIFTWEIEEAMEKTAAARTIFGHFRQFYNEERENIPSLTNRLREAKRCTLTLSRSEAKELWNPPTQIVFEKVTIFEKRLVTIVKIFQLIQEFSRLSRVELSAMGGRSLTAQVQNICSQFCDIKAPVVSGQFGDCMDPDNHQFETVAIEFQRSVVTLEEKMISIASNALADATTPLNAYRVIQLLGSFLDRPAMLQKVRESYPRIVGLAMQEISTCSDYLKSLPNAVESLDLVSSVRQIQQISKRARGHMAACNSLGIESDVVGMKNLEEKHKIFEEAVQGKMNQHLELWTARMNRIAIHRPLLTVTEGGSGRVQSGAEGAMARMVTECRQLQQILDAPTVPPSWQAWTAIYSSLKTKMKLVDIIVSCCSSIESSLTPSTRRLLEPRLRTIKVDIVGKIHSPTWTWGSQDTTVTEELRTMAEMTLRLHHAMKKFSSVADIVQSIANGWSKTPIVEFQEGMLPSGEQLVELFNKKNGEYAAISKKIGLIVGEAQQMMPDLPQTDWVTYLEMIDGIILEGLLKAITYTYHHFIEMSNKGNLYELQLNITTEGISFQPPLTSATSNGTDTPVGSTGIIQQFNILMAGVAKISSSMIPLSKAIQFQPSVDTNASVIALQQELNATVSNAVMGVSEAVHSLEQYSFLWNTDPNVYLHNFLHHSCLLGEYLHDNAPSSPATLSHFRQQLHQLTEWKTVTSDCIKDLEKVGKSCKLKLNVKPALQSIKNIMRSWRVLLLEHVTNYVMDSVVDLETFLQEAEEGLVWRTGENENGDAHNGREALLRMMGHLAEVRSRQSGTDALFAPLQEAATLLRESENELSEEILLKLKHLPERWEDIKESACVAKQQVASLQANEIAAVRKKLGSFELRQLQFRDEFHRQDFFRFSCEDPYKTLDHIHHRICAMEKYLEELSNWAALFEVPVSEFRGLKNCRRETVMIKQLWDYSYVIRSSVDNWKTTHWKEIDVERMEIECKHFAKNIRGLDKEMRAWDAYIGLDASVRDLLTSLKAISELQNPAVRERHWTQLIEATKRKTFLRDNFTVSLVTGVDTTLADLLALDLHRYEDEVRSVVDRAVREVSMEKTLRELEATWATLELGKEEHARTGLTLLKASDELIATLEDNQVQLQTLASSKYVAHLMSDVLDWQRRLGLADQVLALWCEVQRSWSHLESIFAGSGTDDIRQQLPDDSNRFDETNANFKELLGQLLLNPNVISVATRPNVLDDLHRIDSQLQLCEKALAQYLESKRVDFPRFYFVSTADLLDILSNGNSPQLIQRHLTKLFDAVARIKLEPITNNQKDGPYQAVGLWSKDGEYVPLCKPVQCVGQVEGWLNALADSMRVSLRLLLQEAVAILEEKTKDAWIWDFPAQVTLTASQIAWNAEVSAAFQRLEEGYENSMKDLHRKQIVQLNSLVGLLGTDLSPNDRQKVMTLCTIDVHSRDVVARLVQHKVESSQAFAWQSQLRHRWNYTEKDCFVNICDAQFRYWYEYLGNTPRLVVTPLTDRCYITLTQSLHLTMGGAPAGPAGTGKTETTKDLGRALGMLVYVFNCSEQMDYKTCGNIYKGLAQTGAWGCFDEFNRISVEVLSVVAVQIRSILDALRQHRERFFMMEEEIQLQPTVGMFVTMNPGYAGRTELPENLKSLFRPCAMIVPDSDLICEIMLVAEGFLEARTLARKLVTLYYSLCCRLLSKQDHYDWGLRAIKSVLVLAGTSKRNNSIHNLSEEQLLLGALRDANLPRLVSDDVPVFLALLGDLFPSVELNRIADATMERTIRQAALDLKLQPEDIFVTRVVQLHELLQVRHSVFVLGRAGTGKTQVWRTLLRTYALMRLRPVCVDIDPKAVTSDELFGFVNPTTREWRDGLLSSILREQAAQSANKPHAGPKWIVLDGDIDPGWIESLNTLMDDNKILTLASNERIALTPQMRLLFEISHLKCATPSSVSRAGIVHLNVQDLGWTPYITSWIESRTEGSGNDEEPGPLEDIDLPGGTLHQGERQYLTILMDKYIPSCLEVIRTRFKTILPIPEICHLQMLCRLLDCLLTPAIMTSENPRELFELYFVFACVWAFGSALPGDANCNQRADFSAWWVSEFKAVRFPIAFGCPTVFDFCIDTDLQTLVPWTERVPKFDPDPDLPIYTTLVPTAQSTCLRYFLDLLMRAGQPILLVGASGCGKTSLVEEALGCLSEEYITRAVPMHYYMTSEMLQGVLENSLEKKAGRSYGPPGTKHIIYFLDDFNAPHMDIYGTAQAHTLLRQHLSYGHWYDRIKLVPKEIKNVQYIACMNPTAGTFTIDSRLHRHFLTFAVSTPSNETQELMFGSWLQRHFGNPVQRFAPNLLNLVPALVVASMTLHQRLCLIFQATASKFLYGFNLRDLSALFKGLLLSTPETVQTSLSLVRLWAHEAHRVYGDRLNDDKDADMFKKALVDTVKKCFDRQSASDQALESCCAALADVDEASVMRTPLLFCHFSRGLGDAKYGEAEGYTSLNGILHQALAAYNELNPAMELVLFEDAISHVCRINRILELPRGHALLVGVGGSGKQSLARLAASVAGYDVTQLQIRPGYGIPELRTDLSALCLKAGLKKLPTVLLVTDAQLVDETLLGPIHDFLAAGEIPGLFSDDEIDNVVQAVRNEVKALGLMDSRDLCWRFFLEQVRRHLHIILCCSPVGSTLRLRTQRFPALLASMAIDCFLPWPHEALLSVSHKYLSNITVPLPDGFVDSASQFMAFVHSSVSDTCRSMLQTEGRYAYTTPKSFLEQLQLFVRLLERQTSLLQAKIGRLENGLDRLRVAALQVDDLKEVLAVQEVELLKKTEEADRLINVVRIETEKVSKEKLLADAEEKRVAAMAIEVAQRQRDCEEDLVRAEPALVAAQEALNTLNKANLTELKSFSSPPLAVTNVTAAVLVLLSPQGKIPKDRSWRSSKIMMGRVDQFLDSLINYDKEHIHPDVIRAIHPYLDNPEFDPEFISSKSSAAAGLCSWVINIILFYEVYCNVEPKRRALEAADAELAAAQEKEAAIKAKVRTLEATLEQLTAEFERANAEKRECQEEAERTNRTLVQANRLIHGLASEKIRWFQAVEFLRRNELTMAGDVLLTTAFVSYAGVFPKRYRTHLLTKAWIPFLNGLTTKPVLLSESFDPVNLLADAAQIATWNNQGLPADRMSIENAGILTTCERWPLLIDPQLQGLKWIKGHYGERLQITSLGLKGFHEMLERCLREGKVLLIENVNEELDSSLDPLMSRQFVKKGKAIKIDGKEVDLHPDFRLIIHSKLANPHFRPELQAQATLLNFTVTRDGLEEQLLAEVVRAERPDLENSRAELVKQENDFKIALKALEDDLLLRLSKAQGAFLADSQLVDSLEQTKATANDITQRAAEAAQTAQAVNEFRELYRPAASRASLLFFIIGDLRQLNPIYQFSLKSFIGVFQRALAKAAASSDVAVRVNYLVDSITYALFQYVARGLFEQDRLVYTVQQTFQILIASGDVDPVDVDFFLRFPVVSGLNVSGSPVDYLTPATWSVVKSLSSTDEFRHLDRDIESSSKRWRKIIESEFPERERLPQDWKTRSALQRLCVLRALRPDRLSHALRLFIEEKLGSRYVESLTVELSQCVAEMSPTTPLCFILSTGVNPLLEVEQIARKMGRTADNGLLHLVSLGQGQEGNAENVLKKSSEHGHWVILQNIHLVKKWLPTLERLLERFGVNAHPEYRVFLSVQPPTTKSASVVPQGLLESCIKLTSEPPRGIKANLHMALDHFDQEALEQCSREAEFKTLLFTLCYFHAVVTERRHFGAQGWNRTYPFSAGDLTISVNVLLNYIESSGNSGRVPWEDLRYLLGEIMYGGHVTDDWDRRLTRAYLEELLQPDLLEGELLLAPNFPAPPNRDYSGYQRYIDESLPPESTYLYGLHPNAEIGILTRSAGMLCRELLGLQPRQGAGLSGGAVLSKDDRVKQILDEILEKLPDEFPLVEICSRLEEKTPFMVVIVQECERVNGLLIEAKRSLRELDKGLKGELSLTEDMEDMSSSLYLDQVPVRWAKLAYPSMLPLTAWITDLQQRHKELDVWLVDFQTPPSVWLGGFFSPQAFLTAVMQTAARRAELPLDRMTLSVEVTKKTREEISAAPREGVYIHGLFLEGARWDSNLGVLAEARLKELHPPMPVIYVKAVTQDKLDVRGTYECPVYHTQQRAETYIWNFQLKTRDKPSKWVLAGTALLLQI